VTVLLQEENERKITKTEENPLGKKHTESAKKCCAVTVNEVLRCVWGKTLVSAVRTDKFYLHHCSCAKEENV
jgi:hypothetical protein